MPFNFNNTEEELKSNRRLAISPDILGLSTPKSEPESHRP